MTGCLVTVQSYGSEPEDMELGTFLELNDFCSEELMELFHYLSYHGGIYIGGGGASPAFAVALSPGEPENLFQRLKDEEPIWALQRLA